MKYEEELNKNQYLAVTSLAQYLRVVAGAGSGKTRVLTYRIAFLLDQYAVMPHEILAFTFTNKVAQEMKDRVTKLLDNNHKDLIIRTFHSFAAYFLRKEIFNIGYPTNFTILDEEDQTNLIKEIASERGYKKKDPIVKETIAYIGRKKLEEKYPDDITINIPLFENEPECLEMYRLYEERKAKMFVLDFDDLLLKTNYILETFPLVKERWKNRFRFILIDEFQDTNNTEFKMIRHLMNPSTSLYVVGDPDQTIYTWRGANQNILIDLQKYFPTIETIILDCNYRSTQVILDSANKLIANNRKRIKKDLYTNKNGGNPIVVHSANSTLGEADYIADEINRLVKHEGYSYKDIALLYRSNYITLDFERVFVKRKIPYLIYGGIKFYQRKEIKDVLAYFHLLVNKKDDVSFLRIINTPRRGIGDASVDLVKENANKHDLSIYEYICSEYIEQEGVSTKVINSLRTLIKRLAYTKEELDKNDEIFAKTLEDLIYEIGYMDYLNNEDDGDERIENVKTLFDDIRHFLRENASATFDEYIQNVTLFSAQDALIDDDKVSLMTVHVAKGLEFPVVFIVRLNDGVFPHIRSLEEGGQMALEEERRLAYVAMTRAKERLYLTLTNDYSYVLSSSLIPSRFLKESGNQIVRNNEYNPYKSNKKTDHYFFDDGPNQTFEKQESYKQSFEQETNNVTDWKVGDMVIHKKFGVGRVIEVQGAGIIKVRFDNEGIKLLAGNHPSLSKGEYDA